MVGWDGFPRPVVCFVVPTVDWWARFPQTGRALADHVHMRLFAAIVPPEVARKELAEVVRAARPDTPELAAVPVAEMLIPVTSFGNVSQRDALQLIGTLARSAASWPRPELRFAGSAALEWPGDENVWARLDGDVDGALAIGRGVPQAVKRLGFLVDRRAFRPWMAVGSITDHTTAPYLERLVADLDEFKGTMWTLETLSIVRKVPLEEAGRVEEVVLDEVPLGS
jgi:2'-5' RNA ligase